MVRIVADTNVIISAYEFGGPPGRVIDKAASSEIEMAVSEPIMAELHRILGRKFRWPEKQLRELEVVIRGYAMVVSPTRRLDLVPEDSTDNRIIECALEANAEYLVTGDNDLLRLQQYGGIKMIKPAEFLIAIE